MGGPKVAWMACDGAGMLPDHYRHFPPELCMHHGHYPRRLKYALCFLFVSLLTALPATSARAQEADPVPERKEQKGFPNTTAGEFTPAAGYDIVRTTRGSLNISVYGMFRHINQMPGGQVFTDRSEEHTSELQSQSNLVCRLLLEKKKKIRNHTRPI